MRHQTCVGFFTKMPAIRISSSKWPKQKVNDREGSLSYFCNKIFVQKSIVFERNWSIFAKNPRLAIASGQTIWFGQTETQNFCKHSLPLQLSPPTPHSILTSILLHYSLTICALLSNISILLRQIVHFILISFLSILFEICSWWHFSYMNFTRLDSCRLSIFKK